MHKREIIVGEYGSWSKVIEESQECLDALEQENPVLVLVELSDLYGAIRGWLAGHSIVISEVSGYGKSFNVVGLLDILARVSLVERLMDRLELVRNLFGYVHAYVTLYRLSSSDLWKMADFTDACFASGKRKKKGTL